MTVTLNLPPDLERVVLAKAQARGVSLDAFLEWLIQQYAANDDQHSLPDGAMVQLEDGMWALRTGQPISADTVNETMDALRLERDLSNLGIFR